VSEFRVCLLSVAVGSQHDGRLLFSGSLAYVISIIILGYNLLFAFVKINTVAYSSYTIMKINRGQLPLLPFRMMQPCVHCASGQFTSAHCS